MIPRPPLLAVVAIVVFAARAGAQLPATSIGHGRDVFFLSEWRQFDDHLLGAGGVWNGLRRH